MKTKDLKHFVGGKNYAICESNSGVISVGEIYEIDTDINPPRIVFRWSINCNKNDNGRLSFIPNTWREWFGLIFRDEARKTSNNPITFKIGDETIQISTYLDDVSLRVISVSEKYDKATRPSKREPYPI